MTNNARRCLISLLSGVVLCAFPGAGLGQRSPASAADADVRDNLRQFSEVYDLVERNYAEPVNADKAVYNGAIPGMLHVLDPHSNFFDPKSFSALREEQRGKYYGVGMTIAPRNNRIIVLAPFVGTPAYRAGIRPGDDIIAVDGKPTGNMTAGDVADLLKGAKGTTVHISILREAAAKPLEFTVVRDEIPRNSVDLKFEIRPGIGYMHLSSFNETTEREVEEALDQFGDVKGLILDLRGNPGGLLNEGVAVADKFLKRGQVIVSHHGRSSPEKVYRAAHGNGGKDYPLVVLVNRGTASAAEIVSGALQDHDRGLVAGETTFGKGLVQTVYPLSENTALALTTAKYYTPSGRLIQRDYTGVSLYDYYYNRENVEGGAKKEVRLTDGGRTVYGGGGITPDVKIPPIKTSRFEDALLQKYAFFNFAAHYLNGRSVDKNFQVSDEVMQEFRKFLDAQKITDTEAELIEGIDWIKAQIKTELFIAQFGQGEGLRVRAETDPQILSALNLLPKAKELLHSARQREDQAYRVINAKLEGRSSWGISDSEGATAILGRGIPSFSNGDDDALRHMQVYSEVLYHIRAEYVEEPNMPLVTNGALHGLLESLDANSSYLSPGERKVFTPTKAGKADIGATVSKRFGYAAVVSVVPGGPADKAGIASGDIVEAMGNQNTHDISLAAIRDRLSGEPGSRLECSIIRARRIEPQKVVLVREVVNVPPVRERMLDGNVGVITVRALTRGKTGEIASKIRFLQTQGAKKLVLDLRDDSAGDEQDGIAVANLFLNQGVIASLQGQTFPKVTYNADPQKQIANLPLAVLVNRGTSGAAEIVAAAIMENGRGDVIGDKTFGDGSVQKLIEVPDGSALVLSVAKYYTPKGKAIQENGVTPNIEIASTEDLAVLPDDEDSAAEQPRRTKPEEDEQFRRAVEVLNSKKP